MNSVISIDDTLHEQMLTIDADWSGMANRAFRRQIELLESIQQYDTVNFEWGRGTAYNWMSRRRLSPNLIGRMIALTGRLDELLAHSEFTIAENAYLMLHPRSTRPKAKDFWSRVLGRSSPQSKNTGFVVGFIFGVAEVFKQQAADVPNPQRVPEHLCTPLPTDCPASCTRLSRARNPNPPPSPKTK